MFRRRSVAPLLFALVALTIVCSGGGDDTDATPAAAASTATRGQSSNAPAVTTATAKPTPSGVPIPFETLPALFDIGGVYTGPSVTRGIVDRVVRKEDFARGLCLKISARTSCTLNFWDILAWLDITAKAAFITSDDGDLRIDSIDRNPLNADRP